MEVTNIKFCLPYYAVQIKLDKHMRNCIGTPVSLHLVILIHRQPELEPNFHNLKLNPGPASRKLVDLSLYQDN